MNKIVFPALLVATIMVAGAFAFVPVEQASTVHTSGTVVGSSIDAVGDVFIDASTGAVSISSGSEATDDVDGDISIDALLDIQLDAASGIYIAAGLEAVAAADDTININGGDAGIEFSVTSNTVQIGTPDGVTDAIALDGVVTFDDESTLIFSPLASSTEVAGTAIDDDTVFKRIDAAGGAFTFTANPQITDGVIGQLIILQNTAANTITFVDGNGLLLTAGHALATDDILALIYDGTDWIEISIAING